MSKETLKVFEGFILLNARNGSSRLVKKMPKKAASAVEIPVHFKLTVVLPDPTPLEMSGSIEIPPSKMTEITLDYMGDNDEK